jgi:pyruvate/2-oxoglutarate dehydrogenase complex dihydrolipoamide acyltransferase (E2) component
VAGHVGRAADGLAGKTKQEPDVPKAAKQKAEALGVDLSKVPGSGVGRRITMKGGYGDSLVIYRRRRPG